MTAVFDVIVIIVNYNGGPYLDRCLNVLAAQTVRPPQVMLVDNASTNSSADRAQNAFP